MRTLNFTPCEFDELGKVTRVLRNVTSTLYIRVIEASRYTDAQAA